MKQSRKELLKTDDAFISAASDGAVWLQKHRPKLLAALVAIVVAIAGAWAFVTFRHHTAQAAGERFAAGWKVLNAEVAKSAADAKPDADPPTYASDKDKWSAARDKFQEAADRAGAQNVGIMARFFIAGLSDKLGEPDKAEEVLSSLRKQIGADDNLAFLAIERLAYLHEAKGDKDGAIAALQDLAQNDKRFYSDYAQFHQARLYLAKGDKDRARAALEHIDSAFPQSSLLEEVRMKLEELGSTGKAGDVAPDSGPKGKP